jgi:hypothetical protein
MAAPVPMPIDVIEQHLKQQQEAAPVLLKPGLSFAPVEDTLEDLTPVQMDVTINGNHYQLREATEADIIRWRSFLLRTAKPGPDGKPTNLEGMTEMDSVLVSYCLFEVVDGRSQEKHVAVETVRIWPTRIVKRLHAKIMAISGLNAEAPSVSSSEASGPLEESPTSEPPRPRPNTKTMWD